MSRRNQQTGIIAFIAMLVLIFDSKTTLIGAKDGLALCLSVIIPSLFPFFLISIILTDSLSGLSMAFLRPIGKLLGIPSGVEGILIPGFLGGYPAGAKGISTAYRTGQIRKNEAERMLAFCNNAGPSFLFGMAGSLFEQAIVPWLLWGIHILSAVMTGVLISEKTEKTGSSNQKSGQSLSTSMKAAVHITACVCGWIVIFRVLIHILRRWILWRLSPVLEIMIIGILELSNGCCELIRISSYDIRFIFCSVFLAFGGLCVTMQTASAANNLSLCWYFRGKLMQVLFSIIMSTAVVLDYGSIVIPVAIILIILLYKRKNRYSIPSLIGV